MRALVVLVAATLLAHSSLAETPPPPRKPYHLLLGPYEYDSTRKHVPRYFALDGRRCTTIDALESAIAALPVGSTVYLRGAATRTMPLISRHTRSVFLHCERIAALDIFYSHGLSDREVTSMQKT
jgi:hypothetical protein